MSQEIIKLILGVGTLVKNYLFYDGLSNSFTELELKRTKECPLCGEGNKLEHSNFMVYEGELLKEILIRLKLIFGLIKPEIIFEGTMLKDNYVVKEKIVKIKKNIESLKNKYKPINKIVNQEFIDDDWISLSPDTSKLTTHELPKGYNIDQSKLKTKWDRKTRKIQRDRKLQEHFVEQAALNLIDTNFFEKKIDLLLSTAMIESGLDISNVNTIIIK